MSLNYARVLEIFRLAIDSRSVQDGLEIVSKGSVPAVRHRHVHAQVQFLYKGKIIKESMGGWIAIDAAIDQAEALAKHHEVDADAEAEIRVIATVTDYLSRLLPPDRYDRIPRVRERPEEEAVILSAPVWSTRGPLPDLHRAQALMTQGRVAYSCLDDVKALFLPQQPAEVAGTVTPIHPTPRSSL